MNRRMLLALLLLALLLLAAPARAATIVTLGEGLAVTSPDHTLTFDALDYAHQGTPLSDYVSNGVFVRTNGNSFYGDNATGQIGIDGVVSPGSPYFNPFHIVSTLGPGHSYVNVGGGFYFPYDGTFGNNDSVTIETSSGAKMYAVEFLYGNGWTTGDIDGSQTGYPWGNSGAYIDWKTLRNGSVVSSGQVGVSEFLGVGTVVGFSDDAGFDQLVVKAPHPNSVDPTLQELAIDNLKVQTTVPEPGLIGVGLAAAWLTRRRGRRAG